MNSDEQRDIDIVREHLNALGEQFDTIQIFATRYESDKDGGTINVQMGTGNWFARYGQVKTWIEKVDEDSRESARKSFDGHS